MSTPFFNQLSTQYRKTQKRRWFHNIQSNLHNESNNGFQTYIWGPVVWTILHILSFSYPHKPTILQKNQFKQLFLSIGNILPCKYCRDNFQENIQHTGFYQYDVFQSRDTFSRYVYKLHNYVTIRVNNINNYKLTYDETKLYYDTIINPINFYQTKIVIIPKFVKYQDYLKNNHLTNTNIQCHSLKRCTSSLLLTQKNQKKQSNTQKNGIKHNISLPGQLLGPLWWFFLHILSFNYTADKKDAYKLFFQYFKEIMSSCYSLLQPINFQNPIIYKNRLSMSQFIYKLHKQIHLQLNPNYIYPKSFNYQHIQYEYELFRARCHLSDKLSIPKIQSSIKKKKEKGCTEPLYGQKTKSCILFIHQNDKCSMNSIYIDDLCYC